VIPVASKRLGVMGGTFDPIHLGHLVCASEVAYALALDEVVFVPAGRPWQKEGRPMSPGEDRLEMTRLATEDDDRFTVSRTELDREGPTYTLDTLRELAAEETELFFITGADALAQVLTWREPEAMFALATFVGATRPGYTVDTAAFPDGAVTLVTTPALDISGSDCRARVARGAPIRYLVPPPVADYIAARGLYAHG
jgi:nicotinate-nucleotide adenylyltransferase